MSGFKIERRMLKFGKNKGKGSKRWRATIEGGPQLARKLHQLEDTTRKEAALAGAQAGLRVIGDDWASRVPVLDRNYQRALEDERAVVVRLNKDGAGGAVGPARLDDLPDNEQPMAYSSRLEWGDSSRSPQPSAFPAFAGSQGKAVEEARDVMGAIVEKVAD